MGLEARGCDLLDHIAPARTALHRHRHWLGVCPRSELLGQPAPEPDPVGLPDPATPHLARFYLQPVEGDLAAMQTEPNYHAHQGPPCSSNQDKCAAPNGCRGGPPLSPDHSDGRLNTEALNSLNAGVPERNKRSDLQPHGRG